MKELKFCPKCGSEKLTFLNGQKLHCSNCDFTLYHNTAGAVAVIITYQNQILFTRRNRNPQKGKLDLAGGFVDANESAEETCQREIMEELNFKIDLSQLKYRASFPNLYQYKDIVYNTIDLFFEYPLTEKPHFQLDKSELQEIVWISQKELHLNDLAFESQKKFFKTEIEV